VLRAGGCDGQEGEGAQGQDGVPVEGVPEPDLMLIQACLPLACANRRQPGAQLIVKGSQPAAILYDGPGGHLLILSSHRA
jgi:hypothetical protein